jgi:hypothetical protein
MPKAADSCEVEMPRGNRSQLAAFNGNSGSRNPIEEGAARGGGRDYSRRVREARENKSVVCFAGQRSGARCFSEKQAFSVRNAPRRNGLLHTPYHE